MNNYLIENGISKPSIKNIAESVHLIRKSKLPNYREFGNAGSFFKNPIIDKNKINTDRFSLDRLIIWDIDSVYVKVGAARLIQLIKNDLIKDNNIKIYDKHALVLITNAETSQTNILEYANQIKSKVFEVFNIPLEIEPTIIPN